MDLQLNGKVALIAGASSGIGLATAWQLAQEGCHLLLCGRTKEALETAKAAIRNRLPDCLIEMFVTDIYDAEEARQLITKALRCFGKINILVNSTDGAPFNTVDSVISDKSWMEACEKKLLGYIRLTQLVFETMKKQRSGKIINVLGLTGKQPASDLMMPGVINAGLMNFIKAFSKITAMYNVCITGVNPGFISTKRYHSFVHKLSSTSGHSVESIEESICESIPLKRVGQPEEVASLISFLCSGLADYITGISIDIDGGLSKAI
ncbi:short-chain dehydrogenase/reductase [Legionella birminghamensis]|uniref:Short-chain dehydrogenase/reductase n=1 Tax=Legionella birminghamensis TaxID=28083 RepID=A0A378I7M8_9GAMM|nr:SDR family oxidoreductase [Legionella birminghamensis]KTC76061.1 short-chain dehydrogenase/reductase [Legionella birminghamensis]STX30776.1 short-chain dehydrogenase/reductase [Legionella birminghamensis]